MYTFPASSRALFLLCACSGLWAFGFGLECPLASRWLQEAGRSETFIGLNTGTHFLGVVLLGGAVPALLRRFGRRCVLAGLLLSGLSITLFPWGGGPAGWFALRLLAGAGGALAMIGLESLININAPPARRARDFAAYACAIGIGFAAGSFAGLHLFAVAPALSFALGGGVTLAAVPLLPLLPTFPNYPAETGRGEFTTRAPVLSLGSAWGQGFLEAGMLALLPLYLKSVGLSDAAAGNLIGATLVGVLVCQLPIGWLADRLGRERVLIACFVATGLGLAAAPSAEPDVALPVLLFLVGVCSGAFYPLGLALLGEKLPAEALPCANAWYLGVNCFGSLVSPVATGPVMEHFGPRAMFWTGEAVVVGVLAVWLISRLRSSVSR
jgi:MFS family permease